MPNPAWEEWVLPGMHADVGGGYGPEEWIPDLPVPDPEAEESLNDYVYRVLNERLDNGGTPRGLAGNTTESKSQVAQRVKELHERHYLQEMAEFERVRFQQQSLAPLGPIPERYRSMPVLKIPGLRCLTNDLSRLALEVMRQRTTAAGVRWKVISDLSAERQKWFTSLPPDHPVQKLIDRSKDLSLLESTLQTGFDLFRKVVADYFHDSRWFLDLPQRKREVFFGGKKS